MGLTSPALAEQPCLYHSTPWHRGLACPAAWQPHGKRQDGQRSLFTEMGAVAAHPLSPTGP